MLTERVQRQIDRLLDEAEAAITALDWATVLVRARAVLALNPDNGDAQAYLAAAEARLATAGNDQRPTTNEEPSPPAAAPAPVPVVSVPASFAGERYLVRRSLGEGGKKRVYLAHDTLLDRDVALALIKTAGLDAAGRQRLRREAQAMGRLGSHPHIVAVFDLGEERGQPYLVTELMAGGDVEALLRDAPAHRPPLAQTLALGQAVCRALAFAHEHGIIHRDVKPGNVWLTPDGTAKLGDFGLAVAAGADRLTQAGTLVGTVAYLPPEQALGGTITPQSDLYSVGCLLYELVTGRPPFLADDPTAVITQHLSTPPVAPSWLSEHCPPDLDALILHLLAKDPSARPTSAGEVAAALARVDPTQHTHTRTGAGANPLERLARGVFVGREKELDQLRGAFDAAFAGQGGVVLLVGEPGIGKTRAAQELETYARMRGAGVLWGACHEGGGAPAYWPWIQVGRAWGATNDPAALRESLGSLAGELVRLFPDLARVADFPQPEPVTDPAAAQFRLFDAFVQFVRAASSGTPLVVALDDLHWADKPSLLLLQHLTRELGRMRVLVVGTYRDTDLVRTHPLSEALAALGRGAGFTRIVLRGLARPEVAAYVRTAARVEASAALLERLADETEGNPFFLSEVVNLLAQEGTLTARRVSDIRVPDGVREALGRRLDRLSPATNTLLQVAAIIGREFTYDTLVGLRAGDGGTAGAGEVDEEALLRQIDEAVQGRVVEELAQPGRYRFTHALMQETLLGELTTTRKVRLHGQVGEALERRWGVRAEERASRLARHFGEAAMLSPRYAETALRYAKLAAEQAEAATAWDEAARHYEQVLALLASAGDRDSDDAEIEDEAAIQVALGRCRAFAGQFPAALSSFQRAISLYRARDDGLGVARATWETRWVVHLEPALRAQLLDEALVALGDIDPQLEARLLAARALAAVPFRAGQAAAGRASELARAHDLADVRANCTYWEAMALWFEGLSEKSLGLSRDATTQFVALGHYGDAAVASWFAAVTFQHIGSLDEAQAEFERAFAFARRAHLLQTEESIWLHRGQIAFLRCDYAGMEVALSQMQTLPFYAHITRVIAALYLGDASRAEALVPSFGDVTTISTFLAQVHAVRARVRFHAGDREGAQADLDAWAGLREQPGLWGARAGEMFYELLGESLAALGDDVLVRAVYRNANKDRTLRVGFCESIDVFRGSLALRLGLVDEAEQHFRTGLAWTERERLLVEAGRCLMGLAEVAVRRGEVDEAQALLDRAAASLAPHGALLYVRQIEARQRALQERDGPSASDPAPVPLQTLSDEDAPPVSPSPVAPASPMFSAERRLVTVLFTDIVGSTERAVALGDREWRRLKAQHHALVRQELTRFGGHEVDTAGDGFFVTFDAPARAIRCAAAIRDGVRALGLEVRAGLHAGEVEWQDGTVSGITVHTGARVAALAGAGEVLVTQTLKDLVSGGGLAFEERGTHTLKGVPGEWRLFALAGDVG